MFLVLDPHVQCTCKHFLRGGKKDVKASYVIQKSDIFFKTQKHKSDAVRTMELHDVYSPTS